MIVTIEELGRRIHRLRLEKHLTLKQVERACGLSGTHISEIERGRTTATIGTLTRIAMALGEDTSYFLEPSELVDPAQTNSDARTTQKVRPDVFAEPLSPGVPGSRVFPYRVILGPGGEGLALDAILPASDAYYYVRGGSLEAHIGGQRVRLTVGDALHASTAEPHRLRPEGSQATEILGIWTEPLDRLLGRAARAKKTSRPKGRGRKS